jgi:hypothetical protein
MIVQETLCALVDAVSCYEEQCACGHLRCQHKLWLDVQDGTVLRDEGGGTCACGACTCERFRLAGLVFANKN